MCANLRGDNGRHEVEERTLFSTVATTTQAMKGTAWRGQADMGDEFKLAKIVLNQN